MDKLMYLLVFKKHKKCVTEYNCNLVCPQDIGVSKDLNEAFRRHLTNSAEPLDIDFSIQVLSSGSWPFQQSFTFSLPSEVKHASEIPIFFGSLHQLFISWF